MMVLFIGSRGSGKTTIADSVYTSLIKEGYTCIRQFPGLTRRPFFRSLYTALSLWRFFDFELLRSLGFRGRSPRCSPSIYRLYLPLAFVHDMYQIKHHRAQILLYDSNVLRALLSAVARHETDVSVISNLCVRKIIPNVKNLVIVSVETNPEEAVTRWTLRDNTILSEAERKKAITERLELQNATNLFLTTLSSISDITVIHLDGIQSATFNAEKVLTTIRTLTPTV